MKIGVSSYSFSQYIKSGKLTQLTAVAKAKELGFDAIEFTELMPPEGVSQAEYAKQIKAEANKCSIEISAYLVGANLAQKDNSAEIERLKASLDVANALGAKLFRHDVMYGYDVFRSFDQALPTLVAGGNGICPNVGHSNNDGKPRLYLSGQRPRGAAGERCQSSQLWNAC